MSNTPNLDAMVEEFRNNYINRQAGEATNFYLSQEVLHTFAAKVAAVSRLDEAEWWYVEADADYEERKRIAQLRREVDDG